MLTASQIANALGEAYSATPAQRAVQIDDQLYVTIKTYGDDTLALIPGTQDFEQWLVDFSWLPKPFPTLGWCHEGFGKFGLMLWPALKDKLPPTKNLIIGCHSLGAALGQCCAVQIAARGGTCRVVAMGSPRIAARWNGAFGPLLRANSVELYVNRGDPVPDVPGKILFGHKAPHFDLGAPVGGLPISTADHAITLYQRNLAALDALRAIVAAPVAG